MTRRPKVVLIAEVGHQVGWGHVSRCLILRRILSSACDVVLKIVNREPWDNPSLANDFAYREPIEADVVFLDGLELRKELEQIKTHAGSVVSLSYMSDVNDDVDLVVAPALNGMDVPGHYLTDLCAILCNWPNEMANLTFGSDLVPTIGISMGGADVEALTPVLQRKLTELGYRTRTLEQNRGSKRTLSSFLEDRLRGTSDNRFPYLVFSDCDLVVCQGGLSSIEIALLGIPSVIRGRSDFAPAYGFLETTGCSVRYTGTSLSELIDAIVNLCDSAERREAMSRACRDLGSKIDESFWMTLVYKLIH